MGISTKKATSDTTNHTVMTPNVPQWGVDSLQGLNDQIKAIAGTDPSKFVAPASGLQQQAFDDASNLGGWHGANDQATALANKVGAAGPNTVGPASQVSAAGVMDGGISKYLNPFLQNVVNTSLADFDQGAGETRAQQAAKGAAAGAFGGSRWGLQEGETEGQLARARGSLDAGLRSAGFDRATTLAEADAARRQQAGTTNAGATNQTAQFNAGQQDASLNRDQGVAGLLGTLSNSDAANSIGDATTKATLGGQERDISQSQATAPISLAQTVAELLGQNQLPLLSGQTTDSNGTSTQTQDPGIGGLLSSVPVIGDIAKKLSPKLAALFG